MKTVALDRMTFRTDSAIKREAEIIAKELGTNTSAVLNICLHAFVRKRGIPFEVSLTETQAQRQRLNAVLDERQAIIDEGNPSNFAAHEDVKHLLGIETYGV